MSTQPVVLWVHLKRWQWDANSGHAKLIDHEVDPSESLQVGDVRYILQSVVIHHGEKPETGHYVAIVRSFRRNGPDEWWLCNDAAVQKVSSIREYIRRVNSTTASTVRRIAKVYILFYQRADCQFSSLSFPECTYAVPLRPLLNQGHECFINASMQALLVVPAMRDQCARIHRQLRSEKINLSMRRERSFAKLDCDLLVAEAWKLCSEDRVYDSPLHLSALSKLFYSGNQEDAHEFLMNLINANMPNKTSEPLISRWSEILQCGNPKCNARRMGNNGETIMFTNLSLSIYDETKGQEHTTVESAIAQHLAGDALSDDYRWDCPRRCGHDKAAQYPVMSAQPVVLWIHLKRWEWIANSGHVKLVDHEVDPSESLQVGDVRYILQSVVIHQGDNPETGHYVAIVRSFRSNGPDEWWLCNDTAIQKVSSIREYIRTVNGITANTVKPIAKVYILFYQRADCQFSSFSDNDSSSCMENVPPVRKNLMKQPLFQLDSRVQPSTSQTLFDKHGRTGNDNVTALLKVEKSNVGKNMPQGHVDVPPPPIPSPAFREAASRRRKSFRDPRKVGTKQSCNSKFSPKGCECVDVNLSACAENVDMSRATGSSTHTDSNVTSIGFSEQREENTEPALRGLGCLPRTGLNMTMRVIDTWGIIRLLRSQETIAQKLLNGPREKLLHHSEETPVDFVHIKLWTRLLFFF